MIEILDDEEIEEFLRSQGTGVLSLADDGECYAIPQSFGFGGEFIYFQFVSKEDSKKEEFVEACDVATFVSFTEDPPKSVVVRGEIQPIEATTDITRTMIQNAEFPAFNVYPDTPDQELDFKYYVLKPYRMTGRSFENVF